MLIIIKRTNDIRYFQEHKRIILLFQKNKTFVFVCFPILKGKFASLSDGTQVLRVWYGDRRWICNRKGSRQSWRTMLQNT